MKENLSKEAQSVIKALSGKHAEGLVALNLGDSTTLADTFILATANSDVHMNTLMETATDAVEELNLPVRVEGAGSSRWRLIDAGNLVIHIFSQQGRDFYGLERIWGDAETFTFEDESEI